MNLIAGIVVTVVGMLLTLLSVIKITEGLAWTGFTLILLGALVIGLSFVPKPNSEDPKARMSTPETLLAIFYAPGEVFRNLRDHPRWLVAVLLMSLFSTIFLNLFTQRLTPERIANYTIDKTLEMPMLADNADARREIEKNRAKTIDDAKNPVLRSGQAVSSFVGQVYLYAFLALFFFLFTLVLMGGKINFWQAFAAVVYASFPVALIRFVLGTLVLFLKDPIDIHPTLGQNMLITDNLGFLFNPANNPVLYVVISSFGLLTFYWLWLLATGLKNAGEKVSATIAWSAALIIFIVMLLLGVALAGLFPSFFS